MASYRWIDLPPSAGVPSAVVLGRRLASLYCLVVEEYWKSSQQSDSNTGVNKNLYILASLAAIVIHTQYRYRRFHFLPPEFPDALAWHNNLMRVREDEQAFIEDYLSAREYIGTTWYPIYTVLDMPILLATELTCLEGKEDGYEVVWADREDTQRMKEFHSRGMYEEWARGLYRRFELRRDGRAARKRWITIEQKESFFYNYDLDLTRPFGY